MSYQPCQAFWRQLALSLLLLMPGHVAWADGPARLDAAMLAPLVQGDTSAKLQVIAQLGQMSDAASIRILKALGSARLFATPQGSILVQTENDRSWDPLTGKESALPDDVDAIIINNRLRGAINGALAASDLFSDDPQARLAAARRLQRGADPLTVPLLNKASAQETHGDVRRALGIALATLALKSSDADTRRMAVQVLGESGDGAFRSALADLAEADTDPQVRVAAAGALKQIDSHLWKIEWAGNLFYGISLGSVLLLAALGLAITFGLMGVINMAHGELLMIGAYASYLMQLLFKNYMPAWIDWYVIAALPIAFLVTAAVGMVMERTVIRWLYARPLESLLATWGISLILMQAVRTLFGAQNVEVGNPSWMSGGVTLLGGLVLSYNRLAIIVFSLLVVFFVWLLLNHTRLGLFVRAITQNRRMADCVGVPTGRIDMLAFGLGSGIAGLGGVALSQLGNVGPDLGRAYLVDSFMVVVLGGVGQLAGTVVAALGLGTINKFLEPWAGAVMAKITILVLIVLFVQKRPQGLFAPRGRSVE
ncbi:urea ABC transporter permease subunit UrtB [Alcaligenaceae bacterium]|nr:urea ABC transporter permease subunit UrtB [Alcaligenaceae bacterium]